MSAVKYVHGTQNKKLSSTGSMDCTYVSIRGSCPDSCELKNQGCYAQSSFVGMIVKKLDGALDGQTALEIAREEAQSIDNSYNGGEVPDGTILRLHVSGDTTTARGAYLINNSIKRWKKRNGGVAYGYTHCWKTVPRKSWSHVSVLASIDDYKDIPKAIKRGYTPAIVVSEFPKKKRFSLPDSPVDFIPCPAQVYDKSSCDTCQLCMRDDMLKKLNVGIAFEAHSIKKNAIKKRLPVIN